MLRFLAFLAVFTLLLPATARGEDSPLDRGEALAQKGERLLDEGDVEGAHKAYRAALFECPEHPTYLRRAAVLKRIERMRRYIASQKVSDRWAVTAATLHAFYLDEGLAAQSLEMDRRAHASLDNPGTSVRLAETLLELKRDAEARTLIEGRTKPSFRERVLLGVALARLDRKPEATKIHAALVVAKDATPNELRDLARLEARLGASSEALARLVTALERTPKDGLKAARNRIEGCPDFASLRDLPAYGEMLKTSSKLVEGCSGGSSCGTCPSRGDCSEG